MNQEIQILPEHVINQIKAGEVIDSPSGILKELIENSIDAGSDNISLKIIDNGIEKITISDNGKGMSFNNLPLAFARHATSKIHDFKDLYSLHSYGFRGEALASLASVSEVKCQTTNSEESSILHLRGPEVIVHEKLESKKSSTGTSIHISHLFFNTPVRLKFLSHQTKEKRLINRLIHCIALANPQIEFHIQFDSKEKQIYKKSQLTKRVQDVLKLKSDELNFIENSFEDAALEMYLSTQDSSRAFQQIFINKRPIEDKKIKNIINYSLLNLSGSQKRSWVLFLTLPSNQVDINVHPKKTEVRMYKTNLIHSFISKSLKKFSFKKPNTNEEFYQEPQREKFTQFHNQNSHFKQTNDYHQKPTVDFSQSNLYVNDQDNSITQKRQNFEVLYIHKDYSLIQNEDKCFVLKKKDLIQFALKQISLQKSPIIPLLISSPFQMSKSSQKFLKELEIELRVIDESNESDQSEVMIKSLPEILSFFDFNHHQDSKDLKLFLENLSISKYSLTNLINNNVLIKDSFIDLSSIL